MSGPEWLSYSDVLRISFHVGRRYPLHPVQLVPGKERNLHAALLRPINSYLYDQTTDLVTLAVLYLHAVGKAHVFIDGNKRVAFLCATLFLGKAGLGLREPHEGCFADWVKALMRDDMTTAELTSAFGDCVEFTFRSAP